MHTTASIVAARSITHAINLDPRLSPEAKLEALYKLRDDERSDYKYKKQQLRIMQRLGNMTRQDYNFNCAVLRAGHERNADEIFDKIREVKEQMNKR